MSDPLYINAVDVGGGVLEPAYTAAELRRGQAVNLFPGVADSTGARQGVRPGHTPASVSGTTWTVHDLVAVVYPGLTSTSGPYKVQHLEESGSLDPADGSNDRIDALDLQVRDDDEDASGERDAIVVYTAGAPAADPDPPAATANSIRLATVDVPENGTGSPSLTVVAPFTVAAGGILPVRDDSELPTSGMHDGMAAWDADVGELVVRHGGAWETIARPDGGFGVVDYDQLTTETAVTSGVVGTVLCSVSVTLSTARRYRITGKSRWMVSDPGLREGKMRLNADGNTIATHVFPVEATNTDEAVMEHISRIVFVPNSNATITIDLRGQRFDGVLSLLTASSSAVPTELLVEDIGPS